MKLFSSRKEELLETIEELQIRIIELEDENTFQREQLAMKNEIIRNKDIRLKRLEKRVERMLWELRLSDEVLNIIQEERRKDDDGDRSILYQQVR